MWYIWVLNLTQRLAIQILRGLMVFLPLLQLLQLLRLLHLEPTNAHTFIKVTILQHTSFHMFQASLAHHQEAQPYKTVA